LKQWRAYKLKTTGEKQVTEMPKSASLDSISSLFVEDQPRSAGLVLVHRVPLAPPRPILCTDDPEASLLKAIELLLSYPELDALPVVSPLRCTVVAHLTLSYCLAFVLPRLRGSKMLPLAGLSIVASGGASAEPQKFGDKAVQSEAAQSPSKAAMRTGDSPLVIGASQSFRELLAFFVRTHHSGIPIVEDSGSDAGGVLGLISRRDLLDFLGLAMQSAEKCGHGGGEDAEQVKLSLDAPVKVVLDALRRYRTQSSEEGADSGAPLGATLVVESELSAKALPVRLLGAENRKLLFVQDAGSGRAPKLLRIVSVSDVWRLLIGDDQVGTAEV